MPFATSGATISVVQADAMSLEADVLVLKYAQRLHGGLDRAVVTALDVPLDELPPPGSAHRLRQTGGVEAKAVIVLGTRPLTEFDYSDVRSFGCRAMQAAAALAREHEHVALTVHGPGFGLDEAECFKALVGGLLEGLPGSGVDRVSVVEADARRSARFAKILGDLQTSGAAGRAPAGLATREASLASAGELSREKPRVFVAMPFAPELDDYFHYGIQGAVNVAGYLCERADLAAFTGDVMSWVKERIDGADLVVADLSGANPNVYLEVGYAWGRNVPTVLLVKESGELKFDVRGQRCLVYRNIRHLEELLGKELARLPARVRR